MKRGVLRVTMNSLNVNNIVRQIARLVVASDSFQQILALLGHMRELKLDINSELYSPMMSGVVTTYARNFNSSHGIGPLPGSYTKFPDTNLTIAHEKVIETRNKIYAHRDVSYQSVRSKSQFSPYRIFVELKPTLDGFNFTPVLADIPPNRMPDIINLVEFQHKRVIEDLSVKNELTTDFSKEYDFGKVYEWGVDIP